MLQVLQGKGLYLSLGQRAPIEAVTAGVTAMYIRMLSVY